MSEKTKDDIIKETYYDKSGFGNVQTTYNQAKLKDKTITLKNVRNWFYINIENAFNDWEHSHRPDQYYVQRQAFHAGWLAAMSRKHD